MASTIIALVVFPVIALVCMGVVFGSFDNGVPVIDNQQYLVNCPLPIQNGVVDIVHNNAQIVGTQIVWTNSINNITNVNNQTQGTYFNCYIQNNLKGFNTVVKPYGQTTLNLPTGFVAWLGDTISQGMGKIPQWIYLGYLYLQVPALVSGIVWFNLATGILLLMFGLGILIIIRSGGIG